MTKPISVAKCAIGSDMANVHHVRRVMAPNVIRLSCRPPAGGRLQTDNNIISRASPVNCSRWLGGRQPRSCVIYFFDE
jgi:hypothetical protein